ncbi:P-loop containing nucleoside triphosphate hydrolase protein [Rhexocercosporidium sp. MPI-PUGE-AT-0058]|nr:P-loop containing nucleoside triphosphate hydrolase protein [Rhexocercosporidium sp. MPI-PUGE-AT-0058]
MTDVTDQQIRDELFSGDQNIDRQKCKRVVPLRVLNLSMPRTGTMSMKMALEMLGYHEVYHFFNTFNNLQDHDMWIPLLKAKYSPRAPTVDWRTEFDKLLGHCEAVSDTPAIFFAPELIAAYPDAKVILVERDVDAWCKSMEIVSSGVFNPFVRAFAILDPQFMGRLVGTSGQWVVGEFHASTEQEFSANAKGTYLRHYELVRSLVPKERLLEYRLGSGWEPLCGFLGKEVPKIEFPRLNEGKVMQRRVDLLIRRIVWYWLRR